MGRNRTVPRQIAETVAAINRLIDEDRLDPDIFVFDGPPVPLEQCEADLDQAVEESPSDCADEPDDPGKKEP